MSKPIIPDAALAQHLIVLGKTGAGKSSALRLLVERMLADHRPVCIIDPKGDWYGLRSARDGKGPGFPVLIFGGEHADVPLNAHAGAHIAELVASGNRPCIIDLGGWTVGDRTRFFIDFASSLFRHSRAPRWLVIDEVHNFAPQGKVLDPDAGKMLHWANRLASEGRGKGITLLAASQRPQKVHKDFVTSCETLVAMRVIHPLDRNAIKEWIDGCPDASKGRDVLATLASMPRGVGWVWSPEIGFGPERVEFPMFTTYDSFKAPTGETTEKLKGWAEVDLDDVKVKLLTVVKEAEANDPKLLRAEISRLNAQVKRLNDSQGHPQMDRAALAQARADGYAAGLRAVQPIADRLGTLAAGITETIEAFQQDLRRLAAPAEAHVAEVETRPLPHRVAKHAVQFVEKRNFASSGNGKLPRSQQRILDALAWLESVGIPRADKVQLALLSGQSPKSSGYANNLGALRTAGLVDYPGSGLVQLSSHGREQAIAPDRPPTAEDLHATLEQRLPAPQWRILRTLIELHPREVWRDDLAVMTDQSPTSSGFANNLGALRSLGFIDYPRSQHVAAQPVLFLNA